MTALTLSPAVEPPELVPSVYGPPLPAHRAKDVEGIVSLAVSDLFPDVPRAVYRGGPDTSPVRAATVAALSGVDISMIRPGHRVNVICSEHGFGMLGGRAYAEMLGTIRDEIVARTGCAEVWLIVVAWLGKKEPGELIEFFGLAERFAGKVRGATPLDPGVAIETAMGTLYGLRRVYDANWIVHTHYDDPREVYAHRAIDRITKPFGMSYARMETRSVFHMLMGPRSGNFIGRAIADSAFVREKLAFSTVMLSSPDGIRGVDADNVLDDLGNRVTAGMLTAYGKMLTLLRAIDGCIPIIDGSKWPYYSHAGGMCFGQLYFNARDWFDLDIPDDAPSAERLVASCVTTSIKAIVLNHALTGISVLGLPAMYPVVVANPEMAEALRRDSGNTDFMNFADEAGNLFEAVDRAKEAGGTDRLICFDGSYGSINLSASMAEHLAELAPACSDEVDQVLLPRWLKQRGIDPQGLRL